MPLPSRRYKLEQMQKKFKDSEIGMLRSSHLPDTFQLFGLEVVAWELFSLLLRVGGRVGGWVGGIVGLFKNNASSAQLGLEVGAWAELGNMNSQTMHDGGLLDIEVFSW